MLVQFSFENFLSFKEKATLNMTPIKSYGEHKKSNIYKTKRDDLELLKSIAIYGSNGGGKSNFASALAVMNKILKDSYSDTLKNEKEREFINISHRLSESTLNQPSSFEVVVLLDDVLYRYGFEIEEYTIVSEWLYKTEKRETMLFERTGMDFSINERGFPEGMQFNKVNSNVLLMSYLVHNNAIESSLAYDFFRHLNVMDGLQDDFVKAYTRNRFSKDKEFKKWALNAIRFLEISDVEVVGEELYAVHRKFDENKVLQESVRFNVEKEESSGTKKLIYLLGGLYDTLLNGGLFLIDEFDSKLHPNLTKKLIYLFHHLNNQGGQFIVTMHDAVLLDKDIYRRDQIWFIDKDKFGASELYPMSDFKAAEGLRNTSDFQKLYLNSTFGAAETINLNDEFLSAFI